MTWQYALGRNMARFCFNNLGRMDVTGRESVPPYGPLIVVSNHLSFTDPPLLVASIRRPLQFIGKQELFANPLTRYFMSSFNVSSYNRSGVGLDAVKTFLKMLAEDKAVVIFPEGHRSDDHTLQKGMLGVVYLAMKSQAPILPVGLSGTENIRAWRMPVPLHRLKANIGQPFSLPVVEGPVSKEVMKSLLDMIMRRIASLLPEQYQGVYAESATPAKGPEATVSGGTEPPPMAKQ